MPTAFISIAALVLIVFAVMAPAQDFAVSDAVRRACGFDIRRLCPAEYAAMDHPAIRRCMYAQRTLVGHRCRTAWMREHGSDPIIGE